MMVLIVYFKMFTESLLLCIIFFFHYRIMYFSSNEGQLIRAVLSTYINRIVVMKRSITVRQSKIAFKTMSTEFF